MKHSPRPKAVSASRVAEANSSSTSSSFQATLSPRPPPPWAALMAIGSPCASAKARASAGLSTGPGVPATSGAPTASAMRRASILSPSASMTSGSGPTQIRPASCTARAKSARSRRGSRSRDAPRRRRRAGDGDELGGVEIGLAPGARRRARRPRRRGGRRARRGRGRRRPTIEAIPSSRQARMIRTAISPRLAMNRRRIGRASRSGLEQARRHGVGSIGLKGRVALKRMRAPGGICPASGSASGSTVAMTG